jgi:hypothetical protein
VAANGVDTGSTANTGRVYVFYGPLTGSETLASADVTFSGTDSGDNIGESAVEFLPDIDGDGKDELIVGVHKRNGAATDSGAAYLFKGGTASTSIASAYASYTSDAATDYAGYSIQSIGDVDGSGTDDFLVGVYLRGGTDAGMAGLIYGESVTGGALSLPTASNVTFTGSSSTDYVGFAMDGGDLDGDGYADVFLGAPNGTASTRNGRVFVTYGGSALSASYTEAGGSTSTAVDAVLTGVNTGDRLGYGMAFLPDYDGDGYGDLFVGADYFGSSDNGRVYQIAGGSTRLAGTASVSTVAGTTFDAEAATTGDFFGRTVENAGDVDGDGLYDLLVGATQNDAGGSGAGAVYLFYGGTGSTTADSAALKVSGAAASDAFGSRLGQGGDVDGDGRDDVVWGSAGYDPAAVSGAGGAFVLFSIAE